MTRAVAQLLTLFACLAALCTPAFAADAVVATAAPDLVKGQAIATGTCVACHAADGNAIGSAFPKLAQQHAQYLYKQLVNFKPGANNATPERNVAVMMGMAMSLSDADMHNVAAYFESQTLKPATAKSKDTVALGQKIWRAGIAERNVPACDGCHGPAGAGIPAQYPRLAGQWGEYIYAQLVDFNTGTRRNSAPMMTIAARLTDAEMKAVSDYAAGLR